MVDVKILLALSVATLLVACAAPPITLSDRANVDLKVSVKKVIIDNLSIESKIGVNDVVWVNGWVPMHLGFTPSLNDVFTTKLKNSIIPVGETGAVNIVVMRVGFFMEKNFADDIAFVGLLTAGRERGFKCDADLNLKTDMKSERATFKHEIKRSYFNDSDEIRNFMEMCQTNLIKQVHESISLISK